jgi:hypothetical protein
MRREEVRLHVGGAFLDAAEERPDGGLHLVDVGDHLVGQVPLEIGVDKLVGVEIRGVGRQEVQLDPGGPGGNPLPDPLGAVDRVAVEDQVGLAFEGVDQGACQRLLLGGAEFRAFAGLAARPARAQRLDPAVVARHQHIRQRTHQIRVEEDPYIAPSQIGHPIHIAPDFFPAQRNTAAMLMPRRWLRAGALPSDDVPVRCRVSCGQVRRFAAGSSAAMARRMRCPMVWS